MALVTAQRRADGVGLALLQRRHPIGMARGGRQMGPGLEILGQVLDVDRPVATQHEAVLDEVLQLAGVAGEIVAHEDLHDRRGHALDPLALLGVEALNEVLDQVGHVLAPLRQRRDRQSHHRQPEVQIVPKQAPADQFGKLPVGGRHDAHVRLPGLHAPQRLVLPLLKKPQQLHLGIGAQVPDLVEEDRPPLGHGDPAGLVLFGVGERALHVAEQLRLDKIGRQRAAVDHDVGPFSPGAEVVDRPGQQLLARAARSLDEHRALARRDVRQDGEDLLEGLALADDVLERVSILDLPPKLLDGRQVAERLDRAEKRAVFGPQHGAADADGDRSAPPAEDPGRLVDQLAPRLQRLPDGAALLTDVGVKDLGALSADGPLGRDAGDPLGRLVEGRNAPLAVNRKHPVGHAAQDGLKELRFAGWFHGSCSPRNK